MTADTTIVAGSEVPSASPVFLTVVAIHVLFGIAGVVTGVIAMLSEKRRGRHRIFGTIYYWCLSAVFATATVLAAVRWTEDYQLFILGALSFGAGFLGRAARRRRRRSWVKLNITGMGLSYIFLVTAFYVDNGHSLPLWKELPPITCWLLPGLVGIPAHRSYLIATSAGTVLDAPRAPSPLALLRDKLGGHRSRSFREESAMPYADNGSVRIHYQVEGEGPALVLQHGFSESLVDWYESGYVQALRPDYRLILIDARGHGASDKPHDPEAYVLNRRVTDVVAVLDALNIAKALFWGYSMGGWIGFGIAKYAKERVRALVIGGQHPYARSMESLRRIVRGGIAQGSGAFVAGMEQMFGPETAERKARLISADLEAYLALAQDRAGVDDILPAMAMPCCLYAGETDPIYPEVEACSRHIPRVTFFSLPGLSHCDAYARSELVLPRVAGFLKAANTS